MSWVCWSRFISYSLTFLSFFSYLYFLTFSFEFYLKNHYIHIRKTKMGDQIIPAYVSCFGPSKESTFLSVHNDKQLFIEHLLHSAPSHFWCFLPVKVAEWIWLCVSLVCLSYSITGKGSHFWDSKLGSMNIPSFTFFLWGMSYRQRAHDHPAWEHGTSGGCLRLDG